MSEQAADGGAWVDRAVSWVKGHERLILAAAAALQVLVLVGMITIRAAPLLSGDTVRLRVVPVDPRDLFRGDYVVLRYEFSGYPLDNIEGLPPGRARPSRAEWVGRTVFVTLVPEADGRHWSAGRVSVARPASGETYLQGRVNERGELEFGIEAYFVEEGKGRVYEEAIRDRKLSAEVAVSPGGTAALRRLITE